MSNSLIRLTDLIKKTGICRSGIYAKLKYNPKRPNDYDPDFPKPIHISAKCIAFSEEEVNVWIKKQIHKRDKILT